MTNRGTSHKNRIVCGRFDDHIDLTDAARPELRKRIRIGSIHPSSLLPNDFVPISTNGEYVLSGGKKRRAREFFSSAGDDVLSRLIVLTAKEYDQLLKFAADFECEIAIFEIRYPIFDHIKYTSDLHANFRQLTTLLRTIKKLGIRGKSLGHSVSCQHLYKVERKLRFKNQLDRYFAFASQGGYQEVYKLKEERKDRVILALDFNSMFADCMRGDFVEPKSISYVDLRDQNVDTGRLNNGLYRVIFRGAKPGWFRELHPFKYRLLNQSFYFSIDGTDEIEILAFKNEIDYYRKFFDSIEVIEGISSPRTIKHPLFKDAQKLYDNRLRSIRSGSEIAANLYKFKLLSMHSSTNSRRTKHLSFRTEHSLLKYLSREFMISFPSELTTLKNLSFLQDGKKLLFNKHRNGIGAKIVDLDSNDSIFSLTAQILANSRIKMMQTVERLTSHDTAELCYANVDSLHISIKRDNLDDFLSAQSDLINPGLGGLKIQATADKGYWFDVGRYWLTDTDGTVVMFKNRIFNHKGSSSTFSRKRRLSALRRNEMFSYVKKTYLSIENAFSYSKKVHTGPSLDTTEYLRYSFQEIKDLTVAGEAFSNEALRSKGLKASLFDKIATAEVLHGPSDANDESYYALAPSR